MSPREQLNDLLAAYRGACRDVVKEKKARREAKLRLQIAGAALALVQGVAQQVQTLAASRLASVVTRCLRAVFGEDTYTFHIDFEKKRGKTEARLYFSRGGEEYDPIGEVGLGVVDVAAFALRVAVLLLAQPRRRRLLVLDEPFRFVSKDYRPAVREVVLALARDFGFQLLLVTHDEEFQCGKVISL